MFINKCIYSDLPPIYKDNVYEKQRLNKSYEATNKPRTPYNREISFHRKNFNQLIKKCDDVLSSKLFDM